MGGVREKKEGFGVERETEVMPDILEEPMKAIPERERERGALTKGTTSSFVNPLVSPHLCR